MDSSFLTGIHVSLSLTSLVLFLKLIIQFGVPNHPARFVCYWAALSAAVYFTGLSLTDLNLLSPWSWMKWRSLPLITGSLCLLFQVIMLGTGSSLFQQKVFSRLPLMAALLCFAFFGSVADSLCIGFLSLAGLILSVSVKKARWEKRVLFKMLLFFFIHLGLVFINIYPVYVLSQLVLLAVLFYFFLFQQAICLAALVNGFKKSLEGANK